MKKIIILIFIALTLLSAAAILNVPLIKYNRRLVPESLYKYFTDSKLRGQYKKYKICEPYTSKETCTSQPGCQWVRFWIDDAVDDYCEAK